MDEILVNNFMVLHDTVREDHYDLVVGDEAWDVDHFLHENPNEKRTAFVWMTDFVGWLPMPDGTEREARIAADYNAEMIEHIERFPRVRDRAETVGRAGGAQVCWWRLRRFSPTGRPRRRVSPRR